MGCKLVNAVSKVLISRTFSNFLNFRTESDNKKPGIKLTELLKMFDRFNYQRYQSLKLSKLTADMVLHGWINIWTQLPMSFLMSRS